MKPIYDLAPKIDGLAAFCGADVKAVDIAQVLFGDKIDAKAAEQAFSRIKAASRSPSIEDCIRLSDHFNGIIANVTRRNEFGPTRGPIRPEDWGRPLTEFFSELESKCEAFSARLDDTHSAIVAALTAMDEFRDTTLPLALTAYVGPSRDRGRFPSSAIGVDSITLPTIRFRHGERMMIELTQPLDHAAQAWMFFVRNPDIRQSQGGIVTRIWSQKPKDLIRWAPSPFVLQSGFIGPLPGFPCTVEPIDGEYTAYLLLETPDALGVRRCLETEMGRTWDSHSPTYEGTVHMIGRVRTLFQKGHTGDITYPPPTLLMRRYRVSNG